MRHRTLVLEQTPGDEPGLAEIGRAVASLSPELATFVFAQGTSRSDDVNEYLWVSDGRDDEIVVVDDFDIDIRYMSFRASSQQRADKLRAAVAPHVRSLGVDALRRAGRDQTRAYYLLPIALSLDTPDQEFLSDVEHALTSADAQVRRDALFAASLSRAHELEPAVTAFIERATDDTEKRLALATLAAVR